MIIFSIWAGCTPSRLHVPTDQNGSEAMIYRRVFNHVATSAAAFELAEASYSITGRDYQRHDEVEIVVADELIPDLLLSPITDDSFCHNATTDVLDEVETSLIEKTPDFNLASMGARKSDLLLFISPIYKKIIRAKLYIDDARYKDYQRVRSYAPASRTFTFVLTDNAEIACVAYDAAGL